MLRPARSLPVVLLVTLAAVVAACGAAEDAGVPAPPTTGCDPEPPPTVAPTTSTSTSTTTLAPTTTTAAPTTTLPHVDLSEGDAGDAVARVQELLLAAGYWLAGADGTFESTTRHAVVAIQKVAGLERTGIVDEATMGAIEQAVRPAPRSTEGRVAEVDLERQVIFITDDGEVVAVYDASTGRRPGTTPVGTWDVTREIDGPRHAPLGLLYRPKYFIRGVAVHGYTSVPAHPASSGCVRVTYEAMDDIWDRRFMPIGTPVWVY